ncbi:putative retinol dehydrogenase 12 [Apostichopus japonicus]|uniref:Putative retinol dehydrogenase 12 n=1 Tax=Stichopus japonicus TaxID=307972 RepID=A0A2G8JSW8_STIJA|nr:putative retinol dehydrogenase 12 [Apostichopus japonicus]
MQVLGLKRRQLGASSGIGKETARVLASRGARVILACRDRARGVEVENELRAETGSKSIVFMQLDLSSFTSIRQFAGEFLTQEQQLHVLINNAGTINANNYQTTEGYELSFGVNHLGHFLLTNLLMDRLKESTPSRVVNVSSLAYRLGVLNFDNLTQSEGRIKSYTRSKLANILFTRVLAAKLEDTGVTTYVVHPGSVNTGIKRNWSNWLRKMAPAIIPFLKSPLEGAQASIHCAVADETELSNGAYYEVPSKEANSNWLRRGPCSRIVEKEPSNDWN